MTGAPVPDGADAIVMVEDTTVGENGDGRVRGHQQAGPDRATIRLAGGDSPPGAPAIPAGTVLGPAHLGSWQPRAPDGDGVPAAGWRSCRPATSPRGSRWDRSLSATRTGRCSLALVTQAGCEPVDFGIGVDDEGVITDRLEKAAGTCDAVVTSGGVSMGDYDMVKIVLAPDRRDGVVGRSPSSRPSPGVGMIRGRAGVRHAGNPVSSP